MLTLNLNSNTAPVSTPTPLLNLGTASLSPMKLSIVQSATGVARQIAPTKDDFKQLDPRVHVYKRPDMYIGSDCPLPREEWLIDLEKGSMKRETIDFVPGVERLYLEIITNASDNGGRSRRAGVDPGNIEVVMNNSTISVTNYGLEMPVELTTDLDGNQMYVPELTFGNLRSGSNFEGERHEAGMNGLGAKIVNIFSKQFMVVVHDARRQIKYTQVWAENMSIKGTPTMEKYTGKKSSVQVTYVLDFARFGFPLPDANGNGGYPRVAFELFSRHAADIAFTTKSTVIFNGVEYNCHGAREYARLYHGDAVDNALVHYQWPAGTEIIKKKHGQQQSKNNTVSAEVELIAIDTPDSGSFVAFTNCLMNINGGAHVDAGYEAVCRSIVKDINEKTLKRLTKQNKGKELTDKEKRANKIDIGDVKPHVSLIISVRVANPKFDSQSKHKLLFPKIPVKIEEDSLKQVEKWSLIDRLHATLEAKRFAQETKGTTKKRRAVHCLKGTDANEAGKKNSSKCTLYITEGNSGEGYLNTMLVKLPGGREFAGTLPMRGKSLNVMNASREAIMKSESEGELGELKKMLGLCAGVDYTQPENYAKLRYGALMIMADSDVDGKHIIGLILNYFHCRYPSLLARGFVMYYRSPILRAWKGKEVRKFYTMNEYETWKAGIPNIKTWEHKYYKGLGGSEDKDIYEDYETFRYVNCVYDADAPAAMKLVFSKEMADKRKEWLMNFKSIAAVETMQMQPISLFLNYEFILFSIDDNQRSLPRFEDGLKESQRKIIHGAHKHWSISKTPKYKDFKVAQFAADVAHLTHYQHNEAMLPDVIVNMANHFVGANNIPWFKKAGQFGSRYKGGADRAQPRYAFTSPLKIMAYLIREEDRPLLKHVVEEGDEVEPEVYYMPIPMILANGAEGIGTGFSTFIPNHNPYDLIAWLRARLTNSKNYPALLPHYNGFKGTIEVIDRNAKVAKKEKLVTSDNHVNIKLNILPAPNSSPTTTSTDENDEENDIENEALDDEEAENIVESHGKQKKSMVTTGDFYVKPDGTIVITELPIGRWPDSYRIWLSKLREEKFIDDFTNHTIKDEPVHFEIFGWKKDVPINHKTLRLRRTYGLSNMVALNENNFPEKFDSAEDLMERWYSFRLPVYYKRKERMLADIHQDIQELEHKVAFIRAIIEKQLIVIDNDETSIAKRMQELGIPYEVINSINMKSCTKEGIAKRANEIAKLRETYNEIDRTSPESMFLTDLDELQQAYDKLNHDGGTIKKREKVAPKLVIKS